jgi:uncharacterized membrane protein HdeD (DUF308 family)
MYKPDKSVSNYSWIFVFRGCITVAFGAFVLFSPALTLFSLAFAFFLLAVIDGLLAIIIYLGRKAQWGLVAEGSAGMACAIFTLIGPMTIGSMLWPNVSTVSLLIFISARALINGLAEVITGLRYQGIVEKGWMLSLAGAVSVLAGIVLLLRYSVGALGQAWIIGAYGVIVGIVLVIFGLKARGKA